MPFQSRGLSLRRFIDCSCMGIQYTSCSIPMRTCTCRDLLTVFFIGKAFGLTKTCLDDCDDRPARTPGFCRLPRYPVRPQRPLSRVGTRREVVRVDAFRRSQNVRRRHQQRCGLSLRSCIYIGTHQLFPTRVLALLSHLSVLWSP